MAVRPRLLALLLAIVATAAGCSRAAGGEPGLTAAGVPGGGAASAGAAAAAPVADAAAPSVSPPPPTTLPPPPPPPRPVVDTAGPVPFADAAGITLFHTSWRVERVGFHQSNHEGARHLDALPTTIGGIVLEGRERLTDGQSAADIVVDPGAEIRAPVSGTVKRGGGYTLYCKYRDEYVVIAPDANPAWEVKVLHITGLRVRRGQRVVGGETVLASRPTQLQFESQVDEVTSDPAWPHTHVEVVDPSIPNRPSPGGGC